MSRTHFAQAWCSSNGLGPRQGWRRGKRFGSDQRPCTKYSVRVLVRVSHDVDVPQGSESRQAAPRACMSSLNFAKLTLMAYPTGRRLKRAPWQSPSFVRVMVARLRVLYLAKLFALDSYVCTTRTPRSREADLQHRGLALVGDKGLAGVLAALCARHKLTAHQSFCRARPGNASAATGQRVRGWHVYEGIPGLWGRMGRLSREAGRPQFLIPCVLS